MTVRAFITGVCGPILTDSERAFLREAQPWGLILFKRNVETPAQVAALTASFRDAVGWDAPVLVDQEGGRVQRLGPPHWPAYPAGRAYGRLVDRAGLPVGQKAACIGHTLIAHDLRSVGIDVNCVPIADVPAADADPVIGDRAYATDPATVSRLARAAAEGTLAGGVLPVVKHIPGHGRARADSHKALPVVTAPREALESTDFAAFRPLADLPLGMTAHVVYRALDPLAPATTSATLIHDVIRGWIGFRGLLMSDDISMGALSGPLAERSRAAIAAGCDIVLHCNGQIDEMRDVAAAVPALAGTPKARADAALSRRREPVPCDVAALRVELASLLDPDARRAAS
jgi:beta-N-acetylhexosaminidase